MSFYNGVIETFLIVMISLLRSRLILLHLNEKLNNDFEFTTNQLLWTRLYDYSRLGSLFFFISIFMLKHFSIAAGDVACILTIYVHCCVWTD
jgi:hypothetical protein